METLSEKSNPDSEEIVDEIGEVEMPMDETGQKFHEIILSDDDYDSVVIDEKAFGTKSSNFPRIDQDDLINEKANKFANKIQNKYSNLSYYNCK